MKGNRLTLLVSTRTRGPGSRFITTVAVGDRTVVELPLGGFTLRETRGQRIFVATDTGIASFLAMFEAMGEELADATLVYGCRTAGQDLTRLVTNVLPHRIIRCHSEGQLPDARPRRITDVLATMPLDAERTEFYLCGQAGMVADCILVLRERGVREEIHHEGY